VNRQIAKLGLVGVALVAALIVATTYWQTWASAGLADRQDNEIQRVAQFSIKRGLIRAADGTILASNRIKKVGGQKLYLRRYPQGGLFAHVVGYSTQSRARAGLESSENDYLTGANRNLDTVLKTTLDRIRGATIKGNDVWLTLKPRAQRLAMQQLAGKCGSVVALDPRTGKVLVMASRPTYDPNLVEKDFARINNIRATCRPAAPLLNRATDGLYTPGSTFKVVTASAALDSGRFTPSSHFYDPGYCIEYGQRVRNAGNPEAPETFGSVDLITGLEHSINSVFCNIGKALGAGKVLGYAKRYGFYEDPPLETPSNERSPSGLYKNGKLFRRRDGAARRRPRDEPERWGRHSHEGSQAAARDQHEDGAGADADDGRRGAKRHRHRGADPRDPGRGQDGHRRDRHRRALHVLVHRVRTRERAAGRRRGRPAGPDGLRRPGRSPDRKGRDAGDPGRKVESLI
jgi:penicillin-binding protein A